MNKTYHKPIAAKPTEYRGVTYASKAEANRAAELDLMIRAGQVAWWLRQVPIDIGEPGVDKPYRVDFLVCGKVGMMSWDWDVWAEDVTGFMTPSKRRHVRQWRKRGPFELHLLTSEGTEVIEGGSE